MENKNKIYIYLLVIFFAVFVGTGLFVGAGNKKNQATGKEINSTKSDLASNTLKQENLVMPTVAPTQGSLTLTSDLTGYSLSDNIVLNLKGQSAGKNVVGYDVVLYYDPLAVDFVEVRSSLPDFKIYSYNRSDYLLLTAVKGLESTTPTVLGSADSSQPMATIVFKPKKSGKSNFSLRQSTGKDITDLVTDQTEVLNPSLQDLTVEVK